MIGLFGISYKTATVEVRENYSFTDDEITCFNRLLSIDKKMKGLAIISTCNRTEIYFHVENMNPTQAYDFIVQNLTYFKNFNEEHKPNFYYKHDSRTAEHLFRVASGLDSLILGEDQIIGQVKDAWTFAKESNIISSALDRLFQKATECGKRVRSETAINEGSASVSSAAIDLCSQIFTDIDKRKVMFIGAGQTGELAVQRLVKNGSQKPILTNRTREKAETLAHKYNGITVEFSERVNYYPEADIVVIATAAQCILISKNTVEKVMEQRAGKKQIYIDLSVPRNIEESVNDIENVHLYGVDDLQQIVNSTTDKRKLAVKDAEKIIHELTLEYSDWLSTLNLSATIQRILENFNNVNESEYQGFVKVNSGIDSNPVSKYGKHITNKYTRLLIKNLKTVTDNGKKTEYIEIINDLFDLN
jgi:glutamyl-tRNA reductase